MLTLAYCRVSTEEQAEEGYSIEGQADKLRAYSALRDLGEVVVIADPGRSGKDMKRPGLQELLAAVEAGHVSHVIIWRLDRLSRHLGDLILLADRFGELGVALHSVSEHLDLSSASGRMFYNILGTFAQYYREQLSENDSVQESWRLHTLEARMERCQTRRRVPRRPATPMSSRSGPSRWSLSFDRLTRSTTE